MKDKWSEDLRRKLDGYESSEIPEDLWTGIEKGIDADRPKVIPFYREPKYIVAAAVVASFAIICGVRPFVVNENQSTQSPVIAQTGQAKEPERPILSEQLDTPDEPSQPRQLDTPDEPSQPRQSDTPDEPSQPDTSDQPDTLQNREKPSPSSHSYPNMDKTIREAKRYMTKNHKDNKSTMSLAMYMASGYGLSLSDGDNAYRDEYMADVPGDKDSTSNPSHDVRNRKFNTSQYKKNETHNRPISIGFQIGIPLSERWKLHTGLEYTSLRSQWEIHTSGSNIITYETQRFHFIGVPVQVSYSLTKTNHWNIYLAAGGKIDLGIAGSLQSTPIGPIGNGISTKSTIDDVPAVFRFNAMPGVQYRLFNGLNIYAEPSFAYTIQSSKKYSTYYTDTPTMFDIRFGLRWDFTH